MTRTIIPSILLGAVAVASCATETQPPEPVAPPVESIEPKTDVPLEQCPSTEAPLRAARDAAVAAGELSAFAERATGLAASCPDAWTPRWAAGDALYAMRQREQLPAAREHFRAIAASFMYIVRA